MACVCADTVLCQLLLDIKTPRPEILGARAGHLFIGQPYVKGKDPEAGQKLCLRDIILTNQWACDHMVQGSNMRCQNCKILMTYNTAISERMVLETLEDHA